MGAYTSVKGSIVYRNLLANVNNKVNTFVDDELLLGSAARYRKDPSSAGLSDFIIALVLSFFSSPILLGGLFLHLIRPRKKFLKRDVHYNGYEILDLEGNVKMKPVFTLFLCQLQSHRQESSRTLERFTRRHSAHRSPCGKKRASGYP